MTSSSLELLLASRSSRVELIRVLISEDSGRPIDPPVGSHDPGACPSAARVRC